MTRAVEPDSITIRSIDPDTGYINSADARRQRLELEKGNKKKQETKQHPFWGRPQGRVIRRNGKEIIK